MEYRDLGKTGLKPSVIGFGCSNIAKAPRREAVATLEAALDRGVTYFDTADRYSFGASERLLGQVLQGRRDSVILCSKAGHSLGLRQRVKDVLKPWAKRLKRSKSGIKVVGAVREGFQQSNFAPDYIVAAIEASLRRLGTDYLDIFQLHNPPASVIAEGSIFEALRGVKARGLIRHYGVALPQAMLRDEEIIDRLLQDDELAVLQMRLNLQSHQASGRALAKAAAKGLGGIAFEPLVKGAFLEDPALRGALSAHPERSAAQTALRFVMAQPGVSVILVGTTQRKHLEENLASLDTPPLSSEELQRLTACA